MDASVSQPAVSPFRPAAWFFALIGLGLCIFSVVALSSAGRIDVIDAQTRYQVARSFVDHGDSIIRDDDTWFAVFPGRNGERYSTYRFPHSVVAAAAILLADATGTVSEGRRQFFFALSGAVLCGLIASVYASWFRRAGHGWKASLAWAAAGILCTPLWYYGTTAYDDVLGTLVVLAAILQGRWQKAVGRRAVFAFGLLPSALMSGLLLGLAFNCKPPLVLFMPLVVAVLWKPEMTAKERWLQARIVFFCTALGVIAYELYDLWKFPPSTWEGLAEGRGEYVAMWPGSPLAGFLSLLVSPGMGALWYWPALVLALYGLIVVARKSAESVVSPRKRFWHSWFCSERPLWRNATSELTPTADSRNATEGVPYTACPDATPRPEEAPTSKCEQAGECSDSRVAVMAGLSALAFLCFIATIRFFSGEPAWGPRYLTPVFGVLWLFVPAAAARLRWPKVAVLLAASCLVQIMGLTLEPMRFFTGDNVVAAEAFLKDPWTYFRFDRSQLLARPRQVWEVLTYDGPPADSFTPAKAPTLPLIIYVKTNKRFEAHAYQVLSSLRPWWATYRHLPLEQRPIDLRAAFGCLALICGAGLLLLGLPLLRPARFRRPRVLAPVTALGR